MVLNAAEGMRVLHVDLGMTMRGGQRQVLYLAGHQMEQDDLHPMVLCPRGSELARECAARKVPTSELASAREYDFRNFLLLVGLSRRMGTRPIVHTHDAKSAFLGAICKSFCLQRLVLVHTRRVSYPVSPMGRWKYSRGDKVVCVSRAIRDQMASSGIDPQRLAVRHSAIDIHLYPKAVKDTGRDFSLGLIGAMTPQKGHKVFLRALARLSGFSWQAWCFGRGPLAEDIGTEIHGLGLGGRVHCPGHVPSSKALRTMDLVVVPSVDGEGSNAVIKEAWAAGVPVVVSDLASNLELVQHGKTGLIFPNMDEKSLAERIIRLHKDPDLASQLVQNGLQAVQKYSVAAMVGEYARIYAEVQQG
jgi:glycosyltransferase involved in cell wall biosynthesis